MHRQGFRGIFTPEVEMQERSVISYIINGERFMGLIRRSQFAGMNIHYRNYSLDYFLDAQERVGFESIELWGGIPHFYLDPTSYEDCKILKKKIRDHHLKLVEFTPENCSYQYQLAAKDTNYEHSLAYFMNAVRACAELECSQISTNSGWGYLDETREEAWKRSVEMNSIICDFASEYGITVAMESLRPEETNLGVRLEDVRRLFDEIGSPNLRINVDTTAMGVSGETLEQWFAEFGPKITHFHFVDGTPYGHLIWGDGCRDLGHDLQVLRDNHYEGYLGQEITDSRYFSDPLTHDMRNMKALEVYLD